MVYYRSKSSRRLIVTLLCITMASSGCGPCAPPQTHQTKTSDSGEDPSQDDVVIDILTEQVEKEWEGRAAVPATKYGKSQPEDPGLPGIKLNRSLSDIEITLNKQEDKPERVSISGVFDSNDSLWIEVAVESPEILNAEYDSDADELLLNAKQVGTSKIVLTAYSHRFATLSTSFEATVTPSTSSLPAVLFKGGNEDWHKGNMSFSLGTDGAPTNGSFDLRSAFELQRCLGPTTLEFKAQTKDPEVATVEVEQASLKVTALKPGDTHVTIIAKAMLAGKIVAERQHAFRLRVTEGMVLPYDFHITYFEKQQHFEPAIPLETFCKLLKEDIPWPKATEASRDSTAIKSADEIDRTELVNRIRTGHKKRAEQAVGNRANTFEEAFTTVNEYETRRRAVLDRMDKVSTVLDSLGSLETKVEEFLDSVEALKKEKRERPVQKVTDEVSEILHMLFVPIHENLNALKANENENVYGDFITKTGETAKALVEDFDLLRTEVGELETQFESVRELLSTIRDKYLEPSLPSDEKLRQDILRYLEEEAAQLVEQRRRLDRFEADVMALMFCAMVLANVAPAFPLVLALYTASRRFREFVNRLFAKGGGKGTGNGDAQRPHGEAPIEAESGGDNTGDVENDTGDTAGEQEQDDEREASEVPELPEGANSVQSFRSVSPEDWSFRVYTMKNNRLWFRFWRIKNTKRADDWEVFLPFEPAFTRTGLWVQSGLEVTIAKAPLDSHDWPRRLVFAGLPDVDELIIEWSAVDNPKIVDLGGSPLPSADDPVEITGDEGLDFHYNASPSKLDCECKVDCFILKIQLREKKGQERRWVQKHILELSRCKLEERFSVSSNPFYLVKIVPPEKGLFPISIYFRSVEGFPSEVVGFRWSTGSQVEFLPPN